MGIKKKIPRNFLQERFSNYQLINKKNSTDNNKTATAAVANIKKYQHPTSDDDKTIIDVDAADDEGFVTNVSY